ncbi:hypothetical protein DFH94DRAFT_627906 [Russula ochroleuca]|jgi:hypothetical protein|uniref:TMEM205-like domain-containing protein n=1 Tax=Russula ochroleuca TaxID=152965 RepID=A0A9P5MZ32_9AGAM|nr:hypothetical protein DFH94DRAFT_627906 [Russula ochroleuca]
MSLKTTDRLTFGTLFSLFNLRGLYTLSFSFIFGMSLWVTFIGGVITYKTLPRQQFGSLQQRLFPVYFKLNALISSGLLLVWVRNHDTVITQIAHPTNPDVSQAYALAVVAISQALNAVWIGPATSKLLAARFRLEKAEGKDANDADVSVDMKKLNAKFARLHGYSSLANLTAFLALVFHGLWIGNYGIST